MATSTRAFFIGMGTTFAILTVGFGGGLMIAKNALQQEPVLQTRASVQPERPPVRVVLPTSNEPAQVQPTVNKVPPPAAVPQVATVQQAPPLIESQAEKVDAKKAEAEDRERKRRYAERSARRQAEAQVRTQRHWARQQQSQESGARIMAFGRDESRSGFGGGFFGN